MTTKELIYCLAYSAKNAEKARNDVGDQYAEKVLRTTLFLWLKYRPLALHTLN